MHHHYHHGGLTPLFWMFAAAAAMAAIRLLMRPGRSRASVPALESREADAVHVVMNGAMALHAAALLVPWLSLVLGLLGAALAVRIALLSGQGPFRADPLRRSKRAATAYHLLATLAMVYAMNAAPGPVAAGLGVLFGLDGLATVAGVLFFPRFLINAATPQEPARIAPADEDPIPRLVLVVAAVPHVVMDLGMAYMLIG